MKVTSLAGSSEILPRLRLVTSPYAYMATTLPPGAITNGLFAAASITGDKLATNTLTAANFSTNVGLWTANGTNIYRPNGFVGIGTTNTLFPLQVRAGLNQNLVVEPGSSVSFAGAVAIRGVNDANLNNIPVAIFETPISLLGTTVGIGTTNPVAWLDVRGAGGGGIALGDYNNTNSRYIGIIHPLSPRTLPPARDSPAWNLAARRATRTAASSRFTPTPLVDQPVRGCASTRRATSVSARPRLLTHSTSTARFGAVVT